MLLEIYLKPFYEHESRNVHVNLYSHEEILKRNIYVFLLVKVLDPLL